MPAILVGGEKGGTGKSTIAYNMAIMAQMNGHDVLLLDTDKQASSAKFISRRNELKLNPTPTCVQIKGKYLYKEIEDLCERYELVVIDAGGQDSVELRAAMGCRMVTKMFTPLGPSYFDLETLTTMDEIVEMASAYNHELDCQLIYNKAPTHKKVNLLNEAIEYCKDFENIRLCKTFLSHRVHYQYATGHYQSVVEFELEKIKNYPKWQSKTYIPKASIELVELYREVFGEEFRGNIIDYFKHEQRQPNETQVA